MTDQRLPSSFSNRFLISGEVRYSSTLVSDYLQALASQGLMEQLKLLWTALDNIHSDLGEDAHAFFHELNIHLFTFRQDLEWVPDWSNARSEWSGALGYVVAVVLGRDDLLNTFRSLLEGEHPSYWFPEAADSHD